MLFPGVNMPGLGSGGISMTDQSPQSNDAKTGGIVQNPSTGGGSLQNAILIGVAIVVAGIVTIRVMRSK